MANGNVELIMWIVGLGAASIGTFTTILIGGLSKKVSRDVCAETHKNIDARLLELSAQSNQTIKYLLEMNKSIITLEAAIRTYRPKEKDAD